MSGSPGGETFSERFLKKGMSPAGLYERVQSQRGGGRPLTRGRRLRSPPPPEPFSPVRSGHLLSATRTAEPDGAVEGSPSLPEELLPSDRRGARRSIPELGGAEELSAQAEDLFFHGGSVSAGPRSAAGLPQRRGLEEVLHGSGSSESCGPWAAAQGRGPAPSGTLRSPSVSVGPDDAIRVQIEIPPAWIRDALGVRVDAKGASPSQRVRFREPLEAAEEHGDAANGAAACDVDEVNRRIRKAFELGYLAALRDTGATVE